MATETMLPALECLELEEMLDFRPKCESIVNADEHRRYPEHDADWIMTMSCGHQFYVCDAMYLRNSQSTFWGCRKCGWRNGMRNAAYMRTIVDWRPLGGPLP